MKVLSINGTDISLEQLINKIKAGGKTAVIRPLIHQIVIEKYAAQKNITASNEELQEDFDSLRKTLGLYRAEDTESWFGRNRTTLDEIEKELEINILAKKIKDSISKEVVEKYFIENKTNMDAVELYSLTVKDQEVAMELLAQLKEETDFMVLAREYSIDNRAKQGGYIGIAKRSELRNDVAAAVFGAKPGDVAGPFIVETGYNLILINNVIPAILDEDKEKEIRNILFNLFLSDAEQKVAIDWVI